MTPQLFNPTLVFTQETRRISRLPHGPAFVARGKRVDFPFHVTNRSRVPAPCRPRAALSNLTPIRLNYNAIVSIDVNVHVVSLLERITRLVVTLVPKT